MPNETIQLVRAIDVAVLGPVMIAAGMRRPFDNNLLNSFLIVSGFATIGFNAVRFLQKAG